MATPLALAPVLARGGALVLVLLAVAAVLAPRGRPRALATLATLVLAPALLVAQVFASSQVNIVHNHPAFAAAGAIAGLAVLAVLALVLRRHPQLLAPLALAALPFRVPIGAGGTSFNLLVPLYLVLGAAALGRAVSELRSEPAARPERAPAAIRLQRVLLGVIVLYALQALYTHDQKNAVNQVVFFYVPFALLFSLLSEVEWNAKQLKRCFGVLAGLALLLVGIGFVEYATRRLLLNPRVIDANQFSSFFRVNSLFFDPNIYGRFLAIVMIALATLLLWTGRTRTAALCAAALGVLLVGLVLSFSQSSFAALLCGLAVLAAVRWSARKAGIAVLVALVLAGGFEIVNQRGLKVDLTSQSSLNRATSGRVRLVKGGVAMYGEKPILGWGSGSFAAVFRRERRGGRNSAVSASHTIPVTIGAEQGIPGLVAYVALLLAAFAMLVRGARAGPGRAFGLAAFAALVLHTLVYASFLEDPLTWALLGFGVGTLRE